MSKKITKKLIQEYIDEDINPALDMHGGYLLAKNYDDESKTLQIEMGGGCQGCATSTHTLKIMIQGALQSEFPKLKEIQDITDHSSGENPYYE
jgi:Fe-S cluster biogenesis protein NfuA